MQEASLHCHKQIATVYFNNSVRLAGNKGLEANMVEKVSDRYLKLRGKGWNDLRLAKSLCKVEGIIGDKLGLKTAEEIVEELIGRLLGLLKV